MEWLDVQAVAIAASPGWIDVQEIAGLVQGRRHNIRGSQKAWKHCSNMRYGRLKKVSLRLAPHVSKKIRAHNQIACRAKYIIDISEKRAKRIKGTGRYRQLTGVAVLRLCFGVRTFTEPVFGQVASKKRRFRDNTGQHPMAVSARGMAEWFQPTHAHVQQARNAVASVILKHEKKRLRWIMFLWRLFNLHSMKLSCICKSAAEGSVDSSTS